MDFFTSNKLATASAAEKGMRTWEWLANGHQISVYTRLPDEIAGPPEFPIATDW